MIVVRFKGGLGNQFFQYAAGRTLAARHGVPLRFDVRWFDNPKNHATVRRTFDLLAFNVEGAVATQAELAPFCYNDSPQFWKKAKRRVSRLAQRHKLWIYDAPTFGPQFARLGRRVLIEGYFQHPAYFNSVQNELRHELHLRSSPPPAIREKAAALSASASVCIQVRRTDFVADPERARLHGTCSLDYFRAAWTHVSARTSAARGFVFADDPAWAREAFRDWPDVLVVGPEWNGPAFLHQFFLMQACRHFIIANSTWGWWAAWLASDNEKIVVLPKHWFVDEKMNEAAEGLRLPGWHAC